MLLWVKASIVELHVSQGLETLGGLNPYNIVREWYLVPILKVSPIVLSSAFNDDLHSFLGKVLTRSTLCNCTHARSEVPFDGYRHFDIESHLDIRFYAATVFLVALGLIVVLAPMMSAMLVTTSPFFGISHLLHVHLYFLNAGSLFPHQGHRLGK